jgi:hypothetical protein
VTPFNTLQKYTAIGASYNSWERKSDDASTCLEGTHEDIIKEILTWVWGNNNFLICWLEGHAGSGKSTVTHTIAKYCTDNQQLAGSFFFSREMHGRSNTTKIFPMFAYQLTSFLPVIQLSMTHALANDPSIPFQTLGDQIKKLIVNPILAMRESIPSMSVTEPTSSMIIIIVNVVAMQVSYRSSFGFSLILHIRSHFGFSL